MVRIKTIKGKLSFEKARKHLKYISDTICTMDPSTISNFKDTLNMKLEAVQELTNILREYMSRLKQ